MDYDGLKLCEQCGEYTTGRLCHSCAWQEMIDNAPEYFMPECPNCGGFHVTWDEETGLHNGTLYMCHECGEEWEADEEPEGGE